jgi:hypothetical protein
LTTAEILDLLFFYVWGCIGLEARIEEELGGQATSLLSHELTTTRSECLVATQSQDCCSPTIKGIKSQLRF